MNSTVSIRAEAFRCCKSKFKFEEETEEDFRFDVSTNSILKSLINVSKIFWSKICFI